MVYCTYCTKKKFFLKYIIYYSKTTIFLAFHNVSDPWHIVVSCDTLYLRGEGDAQNTVIPGIR